MTPYDCLRAFCGPKIVGSPCRKVVQAQFSAQYGAHTGLKIFKKACGLARHVLGLPTGYLFFTPMGPVNCSRVSCDRGIWVISYELSKGHRLIRHPNPHVRAASCDRGILGGNQLVPELLLKLSDTLPT